MPGQGKTSAMKNLQALGEVNKDGTLTDTGKALLRKMFESGKTEVNVDVDARPSTEMTKKTKGSLENKLIDTQLSLDRLGDIGETFQPRFQTVQFRVRMAALRVKDKMNFVMDEDELRDLRDFSSFRTTAFNNMNRYIKEITGAQMSEAEADRIR